MSFEWHGTLYFLAIPYLTTRSRYREVHPSSIIFARYYPMVTVQRWLRWTAPPFRLCSTNWNEFSNDAMHLVLCVGGNDALSMAGGIFSLQTIGIRSSLQRIAALLAEFTSEYRRLSRDLRELRLPLATCTVYDSVPGLDSSEIAVLCFFNDTITRTAFEFRMRQTISTFYKVAALASCVAPAGGSRDVICPARRMSVSFR